MYFSLQYSLSSANCLFLADSMADRKKPSGHWFRKRKREMEDDMKKSKWSLEKYLRRQNDSSKKGIDNEQPSTSATESQEKIIEAIDGGHLLPQEESTVLDDVVSGHEIDICGTIIEELKTNKSHVVTIDYADPSSWETIKSTKQNLRIQLVEHGPEQVKGHFPIDSTNRKFSDKHYKRRLLNGEEVCCEYLQYSRSTNRVFCFCCKVFGENMYSSALAQNGCSDWHNISAIINQHEKSIEHLNNYKKWKTLKKSLEQGLTVDDFHVKKLKEEEIYWQNILERLIALVRTLGSQNLAFRG